MEKFDIIIVGGGPAGMSAAAELSKNHSVLVLEKKVPGTTSATWYSYADRVDEHDLNDAVAFRSDHLHFVAPSYQHDMKDNCVVLDHNKVMRTWMDRAIENGATIQHECFKEYHKCEDGVEVITDKGSYRAKLLIDAMGRSKIVEQNKLVKRVDAWVIYGARIKVPSLERPTRIEYYPLNDDNNTYVGVHPYNEQETNFYIFKGQSNTFGNPADLKKQFEDVLQSEFPNAEILQPLSGCIHSGILKKYSLDNVIFWGAAGMLNPDGCGMGFNEILRQLKPFCAEITRTFKANRLDQKALHRVALSLRDIETMHFQRIIGAFSLYFIKSEGKWDGGVRWLNAMGDLSKYWMRNEMSLEWIRTATLKLHKAVPFKESIKMIPPNELLFITEQLIRFSFSAFAYNFKKIFLFWLPVSK